MKSGILLTLLGIAVMNACVGVSFADTLFVPDSVVANACNFQSASVQMVPVYVDTIYNCQRGYYLPKLAEECTECPENFYCPGGEYKYSESDLGIFGCPEGTFSRAGMWEAAQCGRILHIGDEVLYLRSAKKTTPALNFDVDHDGTPDFFGNVTTAEVPMNKDTERVLKIGGRGNTVYSVYDDSVEVDDDSNEQQNGD